MIATFCNHFVGYHIFMMKCDFKQPIDRSGTHVVSVSAMGLNNRDNNVREEMKLLTRWGWDKMTTICISFPNTFFRRLKKSLQFVLKGAVNYKSKLGQAMAWHREDTKPLPEAVVIQANGAYIWVSQIDWVDHFPGSLHVLGRYIHTEKNGTVWAHEGYLHPHSW